MLITNIQRFSLHDGAGIRTVVFLKGCTLRCGWCHNPETISKNKQVLFRKTKCVSCGICRKICGETNKSFNILNGVPEIDENCVSCLKCAEVCPSGALEIVGREYSPEELFDILTRDKDFYEQSNGGVTFSGGEPLMHAFELAPIMRRLREYNISVDIETSGNVCWDRFEAVLPHVDEFLFDIKCIDDNLHISGAGASNKLILENFKRLYNSGAAITVRIPVIPAFNADEKNMKETAGFLRGYPNVKNSELMPFHATASHKYEELNLTNAFAGYKSIDIQSDPLKNFRNALTNKIKSCIINSR